MDIVTYALLKKQIGSLAENIEPGYTYKGSVATASALPNDASKGDLYTVTGEGNAQYVWDGNSWRMLNADFIIDEDENKAYSVTRKVRDGFLIETFTEVTT